MLIILTTCFGGVMTIISLLPIEKSAVVLGLVLKIIAGTAISYCAVKKY